MDVYREGIQGRERKIDVAREANQRFAKDIVVVGEAPGSKKKENGLGRGGNVDKKN